MEAHLYETSAFSLAGFQFGLMPVLIAPKGVYNLAGSTDSIVGYDTLSGFVVRLDYPRRRMWLRRESDEVRYLGFDYEAFRTAGVMLYPVPNQFVVVRVVPDSPAAAIGLRAGDTLTQRFSDQPRTLQEAVELIRAGGPVLVSRLQEDGVWVDTTLPSGAELPDSPEERGGSLAEEREAMRVHAIESDTRQADEFERRKNEQLYYQAEGGGWMVVDFRMKRRGPQDGQEWVPFDEMQRRKAVEKEGEPAGPTE